MWARLRTQVFRLGRLATWPTEPWIFFFFLHEKYLLSFFFFFLSLRGVGWKARTTQANLKLAMQLRMTLDSCSQLSGLWLVQLFTFYLVMPCSPPIAVCGFSVCKYTHALNHYNTLKWSQIEMAYNLILLIIFMSSLKIRKIPQERAQINIWIPFLKSDFRLKTMNLLFTPVILNNRSSRIPKHASAYGLTNTKASYTLLAQSLAHRRCRDSARLFP